MNESSNFSWWTWNENIRRDTLEAKAYGGNWWPSDTWHIMKIYLNMELTTS